MAARRISQHQPVCQCTHDPTARTLASSLHPKPGGIGPFPLPRNPRNLSSPEGPLGDARLADSGEKGEDEMRCERLLMPRCRPGMVLIWLAGWQMVSRPLLVSVKCRYQIHGCTGVHQPYESFTHLFPFFPSSGACLPPSGGPSPPTFAGMEQTLRTGLGWPEARGRPNR